MERHAVQNKLKPLLTNYWGERILEQITYLEEINRISENNLDSLLDEATGAVLRYYETDGTITKMAALSIENSLSSASAQAKSITVSCVAHAHIDMNWMWSYDETATVTVDTMRTALALMREYPDFTFAQSQASVYKIIEDFAPDILPEIRDRIKEGRWEVTASTWVETDKNMTNGESQTRHLLYTRQYLKELLGISDGDFLLDFEPDTFGHGANIPEILNSGGVKFMYHCRGYDGHHLYRWRAPSGAEVVVFRDPTWYLGPVTADSFRYVPGFCAGNKIDRVLHVYGAGDHGGGASRRDIERIIEYSTWPCMPSIVFGRYSEFFKYIETLDLPIVDRELNFIFDGCYTSQSRIKKANRISEAALYTAEYLNTVSSLCGAYPYDAGKFADYWKNTLFNQFHDILPGSGVTETREHAMGLFQQTMAGAGTRLSAAARSISSVIDTSALLPLSEPEKASEAEGAGVGFSINYLAGTNGYNYTASSAAGGGKRLFVLYNPTQAAMDTASVLTVWDWLHDMEKLKITDENGVAIEYELVDKERQAFWAHSYFRVNVLCEIPPFSYRTVLLEEDSVFTPAALKNDSRVTGENTWVLENDHIRAEFDKDSAALVSLMDKGSGTEHIGGKGGHFRYIEEDTQTSYGMSSWIVGRYSSDEPVVHATKMTTVSGSLNKRFSYEAAVKDSRLSVEVSLGKNARFIKYAVTCDWREFGDKEKCIPQLAFRVPLAYDCGGFKFDNAFGVTERAATGADLPAHSFAYAPRDGVIDGLMLSSDSKYGFRCTRDSISVSLIRSSYNPDPTPEIYTHAFCLNVGLVKDVSPACLIEESLRHNRTAIVTACASQQGKLPLTGSFIKLHGGGAVISSVKTAEEGSGVIVRIYDVSGKDGHATLEFFKPVESALYADAHERELTGAWPEILNRSVKVKLRAFGVTAVKVKI